MREEARCGRGRSRPGGLRSHGRPQASATVKERQCSDGGWAQPEKADPYWGGWTSTTTVEHHDLAGHGWFELRKGVRDGKTFYWVKGQNLDAQRDLRLALNWGWKRYPSDVWQNCTIVMSPGDSTIVSTWAVRRSADAPEGVFRVDVQGCGDVLGYYGTCTEVQ